VNDNTCIVFCTVVKSLRGHLTTDNVLPVLDKVWAWTKATMDGASSATPTSAPLAEKPGTRITVKTVELRGEGENNGRKWKRYLITDTRDGKWSSFHQNVQSGVTYDIEYDENANGRTIKKLTEVKSDVEEEVPF
jgi:hypothetical protein